jgi:hypothetical protein
MPVRTTPIGILMNMREIMFELSTIMQSFQKGEPVTLRKCGYIWLLNKQYLHQRNALKHYFIDEEYIKQLGELNSEFYSAKIYMNILCNKNKNAIDVPLIV